MICLYCFLLFSDPTGKVWHVPNRPLVNQLEERRLGSSWPPRLPGKARHPLVEWRNPTDTGTLAPFGFRLFIHREVNVVRSECNGELICLKAWYCCSAWDPSVPEVNRAAHQEAAIPASCQGNCPRFQDRSAFPECSHWRAAGIYLLIYLYKYLCHCHKCLVSGYKSAWFFSL